MTKPKTEVAPAESRKKRDVWKIEGLLQRMERLIREGVLNHKSGIDGIYQTIRKEFAVPLADRSYLFGKRMFARKLGELLWTKEVLGDLKKAVRNDISPERFRESFYPYIPEDLLKSKFKSLTGRTSSHATTQFVAGMGRLSTESLPPGAENFEFPKITPQEPLVITKASEAQIPIINGSLIGLKHDRNIEDNPVRRALSDAKRRGAAAVILVNTVEMDTMKTAGPTKVYRARVSGLRLNPERFSDRDYRKEVRRILKSKSVDELIFQTIAEKFDEIMDGWYKIAHCPDGSPQFPGRVFIVFGRKEEEIIAAAAYHECRSLTILKQGKISAELGMAKNRLAAAMKDEDDREIKKWSNEVERLTKQRARTIITNIGEPLYEFHRRRLRALVVHKFEESIPNSKVVSQGSTYMKLGDKVLKIHIPGEGRVTDGLLADYGDRHGSEIFEDALADLTVICHPYALNHRLVGREDSKDGQPVTKFVHVAPICVDDVFLREELRDTTKPVHPISRVVFDSQFKPGVLLVHYANGILNADPLPIAKLGKIGHSGDNFAFPYPRTKYITFYVNTDNHFGGSAKRYIWDPKSRTNFGVNEAAIEFMRRTGAISQSDIRIHGIAELDDATNGDLWFNPRYRPDPQRLSILRFESWLRQKNSDIQRAAERGDVAAVRKLTEEVDEISIAQLYFRGEDFPFHQMMQVFDQHIDPNLDFFSAVLGKFEKSGLVIRGLSEINRNLSDTRDVGVINFPNGNHRVHTLDGKDLEGEYFAKHLRAKLEASSRWRGKSEFLEKTIRAPRFGSETFGLGTIKSKGGFEWALRFLGSPPRLSSWSDLLAAFVKSDLSRGDDTYGLMKFKWVTIVGDKHFYCKADTKNGIYVVGAAGVHTDLYGSTGGFPPNNTGVCFVSIPADGPDAGPVIMRMLPHDLLRDWFAKPKPFSWEKFLPEPV